MKLKSIFIAMMFLLATLGVSNAAWIQNPTNGHYYDRIAVPNDFWQAQNIAQNDYDAHLVTIGDAAENQWLVDTFGLSASWIGFTDEAQEGTWVWITDEPVTYTNWASTEPNNTYYGQPENYGIFNYGGAGKWADMKSGDPRRAGIGALIEKSPVPIPAAIWLFTSGLIGLVGIRRRLNK